MTFSYESFRQILKTIQANGYSFFRFDQQATEGSRAIYLRHDVDISPRCAFKLGEIAANVGVVSNLFFQLNADTYNVFDPHVLATIRDLRGMGHCVGLHVDENLVGADPNRVLHTLQWFRDCCEPIDMAVSFHRPTHSVLGVDFDGFVSGYGSKIWGADRYLSDSRRSSDFHPKLLEWLTEGRTPIQLLLHPEWWHPHESVAAIWEDILGRRVQEISEYMLQNFPKVFSGVIELVDQKHHI